MTATGKIPIVSEGAMNKRTMRITITQRISRPTKDIVRFIYAPIYSAGSLSLAMSYGARRAGSAQRCRQCDPIDFNTPTVDPSQGWHIAAEPPDKTTGEYTCWLTANALLTVSSTTPVTASPAE